MRLWAVLLLAVTFAAGCTDRRAEKVARITELSQPELAAIHSKLDALVRKASPTHISGEQIPTVVRRLEPEGVTVRGNSVWIHVAGSVDDKVYLLVNGLGDQAAERSIVLLPGEREPQRVLWRQPR